MRKGMRYFLRMVPVLSLFAAGAIFGLMMTNFQDMQGAVEPGIGGVPFLVWVIGGGMAGSAFSFAKRRWPNSVIKGSKRALIGFFAWLAGAVLISLLAEEGQAMDRLKEGRLVWAWTMAAWPLLCMSPTFLGVQGIMTSSRLAKGGSIIAFLGLGISCMVFSQADSAEVLHQDPFLSLAFVLSLIGYVEGMNWSDRYSGSSELDPYIGTLWRRQVVFTVVFLSAGAAISLLPHIFDPLPLSVYEATTHLGKAVLGALLLLPIVVFVLVRRFMDR